jgi:hypothetical protein
MKTDVLYELFIKPDVQVPVQKCTSLLYNAHLRSPEEGKASTLWK